MYPLTTAQSCAMMRAGASHTTTSGKPPRQCGFVMPEFSVLGGQEGHCASVAARLVACDYTCPSIRRASHALDGFLVQQGTKTMTATTPAKGQSTPAAGMPSSIETARLPHLLAAFNAANLASSYIERGNMPAARRKLVQALASINQLQGVAA